MYWDYILFNTTRTMVSVKEIVAMVWWLYVLVMMIPQFFIWEGIDMLFIKFLATMVMLIIPMIFWND